MGGRDPAGTRDCSTNFPSNTAVSSARGAPSECIMLDQVSLTHVTVFCWNDPKMFDYFSETKLNLGAGALHDASYFFIAYFIPWMRLRSKVYPCTARKVPCYVSLERGIIPGSSLEPSRAEREDEGRRRCVGKEKHGVRSIPAALLPVPSSQ